MLGGLVLLALVSNTTAYTNGGKSESCPAGTYRKPGADTCDSCTYVSHIIELGKAEHVRPPAKLTSECWPPPFVALANATFEGRLDFAESLLRAGADVNQHDDLLRTPIVALAENCWWDRDFLIFLLDNGADPMLGSPVEVAKANDCSPEMQQFLSQHQQGISWSKKMMQSYNHKTWFPGIGSIKTFWPATVFGFAGVPMGFAYHHYYFRRLRAEEQRKHVGAMSVAAAAMMPSGRKCGDLLICILAVVAGIIFPLNVCMVLVNPYIWSTIFVMLMCIPPVIERRSLKDFWKLSQTAMPFPLIPAYTKFHLFAVFRTLAFLLLAVWFAGVYSKPCFERLQESLPSFFGWWYHMERSLNEVVVEYVPKPPSDSFSNSKSGPYLNPLNLPQWDNLFGVEFLPFPTRTVMYSFRALVVYLTGLWCILLIVVVLWRFTCKSKAWNPLEALVIGSSQRPQSNREGEEEGGSSENLISFVDHVTVVLKPDTGKLQHYFDKASEFEEMSKFSAMTDDIGRFHDLRDKLTSMMLTCLPSSVRDVFSKAAGSSFGVLFGFRNVTAGDDGTVTRLDNMICVGMPAAMSSKLPIAKENIEVAKMEGHHSFCCIVRVPFGSSASEVLRDVNNMFDKQADKHAGCFTICETVVSLEIIEPQPKILAIHSVGWFTVAREMGIGALDVITDLKLIHDFYLNGHHQFGGTMLFTFTFSMTAAALHGDLPFGLFTSGFESVKKGFETKQFLRIINWERGFEAFMSLAVTSYALVYTIAGAGTYFNTVLSLIVSSVQTGKYIFERVCLVPPCHETSDDESNTTTDTETSATESDSDAV